ncbi:MAG: hypothetical protein EBS53_00520 [Bacteroidetes bacterium]|jgi:hypothetical protein|nr:hypothetical protein [Bacteroidota bacterium]
MSDNTKLSDLVPVHTVGVVDYDSHLDEHLYINRSDLSSEFASHAERFAYYATCFELAADKVRRLDIDLKRMYAVLDAEKRGEMMNSGVKTTEKMIENMVITDDRYVAVQSELMDAEKQHGLLKAARDSMAARKEMLVSLGANQRTEFRADAVVLGRELRDRG